MEGLLDEDLPKIMPLWHDLSIQDIVRYKAHYRYRQDYLPDFSGMGIDTSCRNNELKCDILKQTVDQVHFRASTCALPFFSANKVSSMVDPCLSSLVTTGNNFKTFCKKLEILRRQLNAKNCEKPQNDLLASYKKVKKRSIKGKFSKLNLHENIVELANLLPEYFEVPEANFGYTGGCLATSLLTEDSPILLYPTGKKLNKLAITPLEEIYAPNKVFKAVSTKNWVLRLKKDCIKQVRCNFSGYCYVRDEQQCQFVKFTDLPDVSHCVCLDHQNVINIAPSPYVPTDVLSLDKQGRLELNNIDEKKTLWTVDKFNFGDLHPNDSLLSFSVGSHPKSVLCLSQNSVFSFDLRTKENRGAIFTSQHPSSYADESFIAMKGLVVNPFQHFISSNYHLFLCDERYPKKPVLMWNHLLKGIPMYCDISTYNTTSDLSDVVVILGTQKSQELVSFTVRSRDTHVQAVSLSPPLSLSSITDCAHSIKLHCVPVEDEVIQRLSYPLAGVAAVPQKDKSAFTAFQVTSLGDMFYQDFEQVPDCQAERTYKVGMGCVLTSPDRILPILSDWSINFCNKDDQDGPSSEFLNRIHVDLNDSLRPPSAIPPKCWICSSSEYTASDDPLSNEVCPLCGTNRYQSENLLHSFNELSLVAGPSTENSELHSIFNVDNLTQFSDQYSQNLLDQWYSLENVGIRTPPWDYSSDFSMATLSPASSYSNLATPHKNKDDSTALEFSASQDLLDETVSDFPLFSQDYTEEMIPPSQDILPIIGETLRTPRIKSKVIRKKEIKSTAGF